MALLLMLVFHLWNPFIETSHETIGLFHHQWAALGSICVSMFVFLSGFGLVVSNSCTTIKNSFHRLKKLYLSFWKIWIIATPIILLLGVAAFDARKLVLEFMGAYPSYNRMFWFIYLYVELICFFFFYKKIDFKYKDYLALLISLIIGIISSVNNWIPFPQISRFFEYMPCFLMGIIFAKKGLFSRVKCTRLGGGVLLLVVVFFRIWVFYNTPLYVKKYIDCVIVPIILWCIMKAGTLAWLKKIVQLFGTYSTSIWFIHGYFYYYNPDMIYWPKYSILTFIWLSTFSLLLAVLVEKFWSLTNRLHSKA